MSQSLSPRHSINISPRLWLLANAPLGLEFFKNAGVEKHTFKQGVALQTL